MTATVASSWDFFTNGTFTRCRTEVQKPLATVVIGGLLTATFLHFCLPFCIFVFQKKKVKNKIILATAILVFCFIFFQCCQMLKRQPQNHFRWWCNKHRIENNLEIQSQQLNVQSSTTLKNRCLNCQNKCQFSVWQYNSINQDKVISGFAKYSVPNLFHCKIRVV